MNTSDYQYNSNDDNTDNLTQYTTLPKIINCNKNDNINAKKDMTQHSEDFPTQEKSFYSLKIESTQYSNDTNNLIPESPKKLPGKRKTTDDNESYDDNNDNSSEVNLDTTSTSDDTDYSNTINKSHSNEIENNVIIVFTNSDNKQITQQRIPQLPLPKNSKNYKSSITKLKKWVHYTVFPVTKFVTLKEFISNEDTTKILQHVMKWNFTDTLTFKKDMAKHVVSTINTRRQYVIKCFHSEYTKHIMEKGKY